MPQIKFNDVSMQHGNHWLLDRASFVIHEKDRVAILGRNGVGKSTLLKLIEGLVEPDSGSIERASSLVIASMVQEVPQHLSGDLYSYLKQHHVTEDDWSSHKIDKVLMQLNLDAKLMLQHASGGQKRRALLAAALVNEPDVLLLDEPTNHLDIETIIWLEKFLLQYHKTVIFITHDRDFMQHIATRIIEIDLGMLTSWQGDYQGFLKHKATELVAQERAQDRFEKKLSQEEAWIRQGIKARRTRNEGRVRALEKMREAYALRRQRQGAMKLDMSCDDTTGKMVFELQNVQLSYGHQTLVKDFSLTVLRGDKVAFIGPNGCGKSSLIKVMIGQEKPSGGQLKHGSRMQLVYFDQCRDQLDLNATAMDNVAQGSQEVNVGGYQKHVMAYLQDFLFTPEKARSLVKTFSGGERNRLLLAKILAKPSNVLVLDEPTNDLDVETLDVLEEFLINYQGTLLLISHDRALLNNIATQTIAYEGHGTWQNYVGGYDDYRRQHRASDWVRPAMADKATPEKVSKLGYEERKELAKLLKAIEKNEKKIEQLQQNMAQPCFYKKPEDEVVQITEKLQRLELSLQEQYERWGHLESKHGS